MDAFSREDVRGKRVLLPRAAKARPVIPRELAKMGAEVSDVPAYRTVQDHRNVDRLMDLLRGKRADMITFTSSSTARNFKALFEQEDFGTLAADVPVAAIGPITADTARSLGMRVDLVAEEFTIPGLCNAVLNYFQAE